MSGRRAVAIRHEVTGTLETVTMLCLGGWGTTPQATWSWRATVWAG